MTPATSVDYLQPYITYAETILKAPVTTEWLRQQDSMCKLQDMIDFFPTINQIDVWIDYWAYGYKPSITFWEQSLLEESPQREKTINIVKTIVYVQFFACSADSPFLFLADCRGILGRYRFLQIPTEALNAAIRCSVAKLTHLNESHLRNFVHIGNDFRRKCMCALRNVFQGDINRVSKVVQRLLAHNLNWIQHFLSTGDVIIVGPLDIILDRLITAIPNTLKYECMEYEQTMPVSKNIGSESDKLQTYIQLFFREVGDCQNYQGQAEQRLLQVSYLEVIQDLGLAHQLSLFSFESFNNRLREFADRHRDVSSFYALFKAHLLVIEHIKLARTPAGQTLLQAGILFVKQLNDLLLTEFIQKSQY